MPELEETVIALHFASGTLEVRGLRAHQDGMLPSGFSWDPRSLCFRGGACEYAHLIRHLRKNGQAYSDQARAYEELETGLQVRREPRPFQAAALKSWWAAGGQGQVILPTGSGKSHVALMAIDRARRSALVVAPTLDLVRQWYDLLSASFRQRKAVN